MCLKVHQLPLEFTSLVTRHARRHGGQGGGGQFNFKFKFINFFPSQTLVHRNEVSNMKQNKLTT